MSCSGKMKVERLKEFRHARTLCRQAAGVTGRKQAIIIENCKYGRHYDIMDYEKAIEQGKEIIQFYIKDSKAKKTPKGVKEYLD